MSTFGDTFGKTWVPLGSLLKQDANAIAFIDAAGITDNTQKAAINTFVKDLKAINTIQPNFVNFETPANSICLAIYPMVGGNATAHKFNLINPVDSNAAFRISWSGGLTHDEKGVKGDGTNGKGLTYLSTALLGGDSHGLDALFNGGEHLTTPNWAVINGDAPYVSISNSTPQSNGQDGSIVRKQQYSNSGLVNLNRKNNLANGFEFYLSGIKGSVSASVAVTPHISNFTLFSFNGTYATKQIASYFAIRKSSISDDAMLLYIDAILKLNNTLLRLSKKNIVFEGHSFFHNQPSTNSNDWAVEKTVRKLNANYDTRIYSYVASAISGTTILDSIVRKSTAVDPYKKTKYGFKNIIPIWHGINDISSTEGSGTTAYNNYKLYWNSLVADGWIPICITTTPTGGIFIGRNPEIVIFNNLLRNDLQPTHLIDTDLIPELTDATNATYFQSDQLHLTAAANELVSTALANLIAAI